MKDKLKMPIFILAWVVFVTAYFFTTQSPLTMRIIFKAMPEILIVVTLIGCRRQIGRVTFISVILALLFSIAGDTAGEFKGGPNSRSAFVIQIAMFAVAQFCYTASFIRHIETKRLKNVKSLTVRLLLSIPFLVYLGIVASKVLPAMGSAVLVLAGCVYIFALAATGLTSVFQTRKGQAFYVTGAAVFIFSDSIIAINSFVSPVAHAGTIIMGSYFIAQLLLNFKLLER